MTQFFSRLSFIVESALARESSLLNNSAKIEQTGSMYPSREEFTELIYYISELKHTYSHKIDEQSIKINEQSMTIEELLWQIRELSDKIRQLNQWRGETERVISDSRRKFDELSKACTCRYENHFPRNRVSNSRRSQHSSSGVNSRKNGNNLEKFIVIAAAL
jgi:uncharacterized coiled-coil DUF342 family protein